MNKIIRYWNQNREKIIIVIAIIAFFIIVIQVINGLLKNSNYSSRNINTNKTIDVTKPNKSEVTGQELTEKVTETNTDLIKEFVTYCNDGEIQKAYDLLSSDCKAEYRDDISIFKNNYFNKVFNKAKTYKLDLVGSTSGAHTYKITYYKEDLLATGGKSSDNIEDYITIIKENNENKINISSFIRKENINKTQSNDDIEIIVNSKRVYRSYEIYNLTIKNNTNNSISISDGINNLDIYLMDKSNTKYTAFINEIPMYNLSLSKKQQINLEIKFNKIYDVYRNIEKMCFDNIKIEEKNNQVIKIIVEL